MSYPGGSTRRAVYYCLHPGGTADYTTYLGAATIIEAAHPDLRIPASESRCFTGAAAVEPADEDETTGTLHWYVCDAWNRLIEVWQDDGDGSQEITGETPDDTQIAAYEYDGLHRRIQKTDKTGESDVTYDYYYNTAWQVLEVRIDSDTDPYKQYLWDVRYIDAPVVRWRDGNTDGDLDDAGDDTLYYCTDANFNVTALVSTAGSVVERYVYSPYGQPAVLDADWSDDADGASDFDNHILYCGYRYDPPTGLYQVRYRPYHPTFGRWVVWDPTEYTDSLNLYDYVRSSPARFTDPAGLAGKKPDKIDVVNPTVTLDYGNMGLTRLDWEGSPPDPLEAGTWYNPIAGKFENDYTVSADRRPERDLRDLFHVSGRWDLTWWPNGAPRSQDRVGSAGTSGWAVGVLLKTSVIADKGTCWCDFTGSQVLVFLYRIRWVKEEDERHVVLIGHGGATWFTCPSTLDHEGWHTDGLPKWVYDRAREAGLTIPKEFRHGFRGRAKEALEKTLIEFSALAIYHPPRDKRGPQTTVAAQKEWCEKEAKKIIEVTINNQKTADYIKEGGTWHEAFVGTVRVTPGSAPVPAWVIPAE